MMLQDLSVKACEFHEVVAFVCWNHYSHSVKGLTPQFRFAVRNGPTIVGAAIFGQPAGRGVAEAYNQGETLVELRRFVLLDECPKTSESFALSRMLRNLKSQGVRFILSFADPNEKREGHPDGMHTGLIYRAVGFDLVKLGKPKKAIWFEGRRYPARNLDQYNKFKIGGEPLTRLSLRLRAALASGQAVWKRELGKIAYLFDTSKHWNKPTLKLKWALKLKARMAAKGGLKGSVLLGWH